MGFSLNNSLSIQILMDAEFLSLEWFKSDSKGCHVIYSTQHNKQN